MTAVEMAKKYYPKLWNKARLIALVEATPQKLTEAEYEEATGETYTSAASI